MTGIELAGFFASVWTLCYPTVILSKAVVQLLKAKWTGIKQQHVEFAEVSNRLATKDREVASVKADLATAEDKVAKLKQDLIEARNDRDESRQEATLVRAALEAIRQSHDEQAKVFASQRRSG